VGKDGAKEALKQYIACRVHEIAAAMVGLGKSATTEENIIYSAVLDATRLIRDAVLFDDPVGSLRYAEKTLRTLKYACLQIEEGKKKG